MSFTSEDIEKAKQNTLNASIECGFADSKEEVDVSYITKELLERYESAEEKKESSCSNLCDEMGKELLSEGIVKANNYPCF